VKLRVSLWDQYLASPEKLQINLHSALDFSIPQRKKQAFCRNKGPPFWSAPLKTMLHRQETKGLVGLSTWPYPLCLRTEHSPAINLLVLMVWIVLSPQISDPRKSRKPVISGIKIMFFWRKIYFIPGTPDKLRTPCCGFPACGPSREKHPCHTPGRNSLAVVRFAICTQEIWRLEFQSYAKAKLDDGWPESE
jgi:hypothetical protein